METDNLKVLTLDSIPTLKQLIGSGGGSGEGVLYDEYGTNTDGSLTQAFISSKLDGESVAIGQGVAVVKPGYGTTPYRGILIGYNTADKQKGSGAIGTASYGATNGIAIGNNAQITATDNAGGSSGIALGPNTSAAASSCVSIGNSSETSGHYCIGIGYNASAGTGQGSIAIGGTAKSSAGVAIGYGAKCSRSDAVSIGNADSTTSAIAKTRFLQNVTAGALDTDATNVSQLRSVAIGEVLYTSTEASSTITLSNPVSQYEKIEIIGSWTMPYTAATTPLQVIEHWHLNDQDNSSTFQLRAEDVDVENQERTDVVETWTLTNATTIDLVSSAIISGTLAAPTAENSEAPHIIITKVVGYKAI